MEEQNYEPIQDENITVNKTNKSIFAFVAIMIIGVVFIGYGLLMYNKPRFIFDQAVKKFLSSDEANIDYNTMKFNADFEVSIDSKESEVKEISELLNDAKFSISTEIDKQKQEELFGIKMSKVDEELFNVNVKMEEETQKMYYNLGKFFNKTIQMDISEISDESFEIADSTVTTFTQRINGKKAKAIFEKEIKTQLKNEYFSSEKVVIDEEKVVKNQLRMSTEQFCDVVKNIFKNLSENETFIKCYEDEDSIKNDLEEIVEELEDLELDEEESYVEIDVYTKGISKNVKRIDLLVENDDEKTSIQTKKLSKEEYEYKLFDNEEQVCEGIFKYKGNDNNFELEISASADDTEIRLKSIGNVAYDEEISDFDTSNAVNYQELSTEDMYEIVGNFMQSKLYKILSELSETNSSILGDTTEEKALYDDDDDDYNYFYEEEEDDDDDENTTSSTENNIVKTYKGDAIKFNIPDGFEIYSSDSEHYKLFNKEVGDDTIDVDVSISYETLEEYIEDVKEQEKYYKNDEYYKNYKISDVEEMEVNGNKFKKVVITYDYGFSDDEKNWNSHCEYYIACEVNNDHIYTVEIDGADLISDSELKQFLSIEK